MANNTNAEEDLSNVTPLPKVRRAELIKPPNKLKQKVGSGGLDQKLIERAQTSIDDNKVDFKPIADILLGLMDEAMHEAQSGAATGETAIEAIIYPAMQLKAQGTMFHYPLVTDVSNILVNFLETVTIIDKDMLDIVQAHSKALHVVIAGKMQGSTGAVGQELCSELMAACNRFYKSRSG